MVSQPSLYHRKILIIFGKHLQLFTHPVKRDLWKGIRIGLKEYSLFHKTHAKDTPMEEGWQLYFVSVLESLILL